MGTLKERGMAKICLTGAGFLIRGGTAREPPYIPPRNSRIKFAAASKALKPRRSARQGLRPNPFQHKEASSVKPSRENGRFGNKTLEDIGSIPIFTAFGSY